MKKILIACLILSAACNEDNPDNINPFPDSIQSTPTAIDTVQHPNGITAGGVISTDTAAMRADTTLRP